MARFEGNEALRLDIRRARAHREAATNHLKKRHVESFQWRLSGHVDTLIVRTAVRSLSSRIRPQNQECLFHLDDEREAKVKAARLCLPSVYSP